MDSVFFVLTDDVIGTSTNGSYPQLEQYITESIIPIVKDTDKKETVSEFLYELIWSCFNDRFDEYYLISLLVNIQKHSNDSFSTLMCDLLWMIGQEIDPALGYKNKDLLKLFGSLVRKLERERICKLSELKSRLEVDKLIACGLAGEDFRKCIIRKYTQRHYTQQKFNLIRDENEGFSKLLSYLHQPKLDDSTLLPSVLSHIGIFSLDPNRVFDMIMDACEFEPGKYDILKSLFNHFKITEMENLLGLKIDYYKTHDNKKIPSSLISFMIHLIKDELIPFDFIKRVLADEEEEMRRYAQARTDIIYTKINSIRKLDKDIPKSPSDLLPLPESINWITTLIISCSFLKLDQVMTLWKYIRDTGIDPCWFRDCNKALCRFLCHIATPVYMVVNPFPNMTTQYSQLPTKSQYLSEEDRITDITQLITRLTEPVSLLGPHIAKEPFFFTMFCRILAFYLSTRKDSLESDPLYSTIESFYRCDLIPSLSMITPSVVASHEIWEGLQYFPQRTRFYMYSYWQSEEVSKNPDLFFGLKRYYLSIDYHFRRTDGTNVKEKAKMLVYYCYATPLYFFQSLIFKCQTFDNFIDLVVPNLSAISEIAIDCAMYCILDALESRTTKYEENGVTLDKGFDLTIEFASSFVKFFVSKVDITLLMEYIDTCLKGNDIVIAILLSRLISKVANIPSALEVVTPAIELSTLRCLSSSILAQSITRSTNPTKTLQFRPTLIKAILSSNLLPTLLFHFPKAITEITYSNEYDDLSKLSILSDRNMDIFNHVLMLLRENDDYKKLLPSILNSPEQLFIKYNLDVQFAFSILRSIFDMTEILPTLQNPSTDPSPWNLMSPSNIKTIKRFYPETLWTSLSINGFMAFWLLDYRDLTNLSSCYEEYVRVINEEIKKKQEKVTSRSERAVTKAVNDWKKEIERIQEEEKRGKDHVEKIQESLQMILSGFFCGDDIDASTTSFIQYCLVPRVLSSSEGALFSYQFVRRIVEAEVGKYNHILFVRRVLFVLLSLLRGATEAESLNISIFLVELFNDLCQWSESEKKYSEFCEKKNCFKNDTKKGDEDAVLTYDQYKKKYNHWMKFISVIVISGLQSKDVLHIRNSLNFLQRMKSVYPRHSGYADVICPFLENLTFMNNGGIKTSAEMLLNELKQIKKM